MRGNFKNLETIALSAREAFEGGSVPRRLLRTLYLSYNPNVQEIDGFLDRAQEIFPLGNCGLASVYLRHLYGEGAVVRGKFENEPHTFWLGHLAVDITGDQFGGPAVYVGPLQYPLHEFGHMATSSPIALL